MMDSIWLTEIDVQISNVQIIGFATTFLFSVILTHRVKNKNMVIIYLYPLI